jgi:pyridoxamine 5'-phosphate oxidase
MIEFKNMCNAAPYKLFKNKYEDALNLKHKSIEAIAISSYSPELNEVNSRYVNLKYIIDNDFIFFSNYESPKSKEFLEHNQITALIYWNTINTQIRLKAHVKRTSKQFNNEYFQKRAAHKNALAISSKQSELIGEYSEVLENYNKSLKFDNLKECPEYWGGFSFTPYYFEFWEGHKSRMNKREVFNKIDGDWEQSFLQP